MNREILEGTRHSGSHPSLSPGLLTAPLLPLRSPRSSQAHHYPALTHLSGSLETREFAAFGPAQGPSPHPLRAPVTAPEPRPASSARRSPTLRRSRAESYRTPAASASGPAPRPRPALSLKACQCPQLHTGADDRMTSRDVLRHRWDKTWKTWESMSQTGSASSPCRFFLLPFSYLSLF